MLLHISRDCCILGGACAIESRPGAAALPNVQQTFKVRVDVELTMFEQDSPSLQKLELIDDTGASVIESSCVATDCGALPECSMPSPSLATWAAFLADPCDLLSI